MRDPVVCEPIKMATEASLGENRESRYESPDWILTMVDFVCAVLACSRVSILRNSPVRKVGGIWFARLGRVRVSFCIAKPYSE